MWCLALLACGIWPEGAQEEDSGSIDSDVADTQDSSEETDVDTEQPQDTEVPDSEYCEGVREWSSTASEFEREVLSLVNAQRAQGGQCADLSFDPSGELTMNAELRCAARVHSLDMVENDYFAHEDLDGGEPWDRAEDAGYSNWTAVGENIAFGYTTPEEVMEGWMNSPGHCENILDPEYHELGVGYVGGAEMWTQVFGAR